MTGPSFLDDPRMARVFGLTPEAKGTPATAPQPMDINAERASLASRLARGGKLSNSAEKIGGEIPTDSGFMRGGEFSPEEMASYVAAAKRLNNATDAEQMSEIIHHIRSLGAAAPTDATATRKP